MSYDKYKVIGISGKLNAGKDTVASMINYIHKIGVNNATYAEWLIRKNSFDETYKDRIVHYADNLKDIISILYSIPRHLLDDRDFKDKLYYCINNNSFYHDYDIKDKKYIITIDDLEAINLKAYIDTYPVVYIKLRTLLQYIGTNICRNKLSNDIWIRNTRNKYTNIAMNTGICIIPDVRFKNEADAITTLKVPYVGCIIKVKRDDKLTSHESEVIDFTSAYTIENYGTKVNLFYNVLSIYQKICKR
mgnify:CR=1 FL=1